jgi:hypothetical protein
MQNQPEKYLKLTGLASVLFIVGIDCLPQWSSRGTGWLNDAQSVIIRGRRFEECTPEGKSSTFKAFFSFPL